MLFLAIYFTFCGFPVSQAGMPSVIFREGNGKMMHPDKNREMTAFLGQQFPGKRIAGCTPSSPRVGWTRARGFSNLHLLTSLLWGDTWSNGIPAARPGLGMTCWICLHLQSAHHISLPLLIYGSLSLVSRALPEGRDLSLSITYPGACKVTGLH